MKVIIDADILRYQLGSIKAKHPFLEGEFIPAPEDEIKNLVGNLINDIISATNADEYVCPLSGKGNFRDEIAKQEPYKGNRDPNSTRPYHYDTVGDYIKNNHPCVVVDGMEADDWLGIEQRKDPHNTVIASRDKDLKTVYGYHYRWACGDKQPEVPMYWESEFEACKFFFHQMLIGDNTDNIMGCGRRVEMKWGGKMMLRRKGVGKVASEKLLAGCETVQELYDTVKEQYKIYFQDNWEEIMLENARLLYIGQTPDNLFEWDWLDYNLNKEGNNEPVSTEECELPGIDFDGESRPDC